MRVESVGRNQTAWGELGYGTVLSRRKASREGMMWG